MKMNYNDDNDIIRLIDYNILWKASHPVSYRAYGSEENDFNLCHGENPDVACSLILLGLPGHCYEYDLPLL